MIKKLLVLAMIISTLMCGIASAASDEELEKMQDLLEWQEKLSEVADTTVILGWIDEDTLLIFYVYDDDIIEMMNKQNIETTRMVSEAKEALGAKTRVEVTYLKEYSISVYGVAPDVSYYFSGTAFLEKEYR